MIVTVMRQATYKPSAVAAARHLIARVGGGARESPACPAMLGRGRQGWLGAGGHAAVVIVFRGGQRTGAALELVQRHDLPVSMFACHVRVMSVSAHNAQRCSVPAFLHSCVLVEGQACIHLYL